MSLVAASGRSCPENCKPRNQVFEFLNIFYISFNFLILQKVIVRHDIRLELFSFRDRVYCPSVSLFC